MMLILQIAFGVAGGIVMGGSALWIVYVVENGIRTRRWFEYAKNHPYENPGPRPFRG